MKYLLIGILFALLGVAVSLLIWGLDMVITISTGIGLFFIGIACILSGAFVSGDRMRANLATESDEGRTQRNNMSFHSALIGIPSIVVAFLFYFFKG